MVECIKSEETLLDEPDGFRTPQMLVELWDDFTGARIVEIQAGTPPDECQVYLEIKDLKKLRNWLNKVLPP